MVRCKPTTGKLTVDSIKENDCAFFSTIFWQHSVKMKHSWRSIADRSFSRAIASERGETSEGGKDQGVEIGRFAARHGFMLHFIDAGWHSRKKTRE